MDMKQPYQLELSHVQYAGWAGGEGPAWCAILHVNNQPAFLVADRGRGGPLDYSPIPPFTPADLRALEEWARPGPPPEITGPDSLLPSLDGLVEDMVAAWLEKDGPALEISPAEATLILRALEQYARGIEGRLAAHLRPEFDEFLGATIRKVREFVGEARE